MQVLCTPRRQKAMWLPLTCRFISPHSLVQRRDIYPGLFVKVTLLPPSPQHVHQPLAACDPHLSFGAPPDISGLCFDPDHTPRAAPASCSSSSPSQQGTGMPCSVEGKGTALSCPRDPLFQQLLLIFPKEKVAGWREAAHEF